MPLTVCPNDGTAMQQINPMGVLIDVCPQCRGTWFDRGELEKLMDEAQRIESGYEREREDYYRDQRKPYKKKESVFERLSDFFD